MLMKSRWNKCLYSFYYLGCYLQVWHCYLGSILAFKIQIQISYNLWTKPLNQLRLIYEQFIHVLYLDLVVYISFVMNKFWLIDWLIDWSWNDYESGFFSLLKIIHSWNFKRDLWITNHKSLIQTLDDVLLVWVKYMVKYINICIIFLMHDKLMR